MPPIILASSSIQRRNLFSSLGIPFEVIPAEIDEKTIRDPDLMKQAEKIACAKAEAVAAGHAGIVIAADTFVEMDGDVLEKPVDLEEARAMLRRQSGKRVQAITGYCYLDPSGRSNESGAVATELLFRDLSPQEIDAYMISCPVLSWSGAFSPAYPYGASLIAEVHGSLTGFIYGLPMEKIVPLLSRSGIDVCPTWE